MSNFNLSFTIISAKTKEDEPYLEFHNKTAAPIFYYSFHLKSYPLENILSPEYFAEIGPKSTFKTSTTHATLNVLSNEQIEFRSPKISTPLYKKDGNFYISKESAMKFINDNIMALESTIFCSFLIVGSNSSCLSNESQQYKNNNIINPQFSIFEKEKKIGLDSYTLIRIQRFLMWSCVVCAFFIVPLIGLYFFIDRKNKSAKEEANL